jgi:hypothetical protein
MMALRCAVPPPDLAAVAGRRVGRRLGRLRPARLGQHLDGRRGRTHGARRGLAGRPPRAGRGAHVAHAFYVNKVEGDFIRTIEGNSNRDGGNQGTGVFRQRRLWNGNDNARGFGRPEYVEPAERPVVRLVHLSDAVVVNIAGGEGTVSHPRDVRVLEAALLAEELLSTQYEKDDSFGVKTRMAYAQWQRGTGLPRVERTGTPNLGSLRRLGRRHGFKVEG